MKKMVVKTIVTCNENGEYDVKMEPEEWPKGDFPSGIKSFFRFFRCYITAYKEFKKIGDTYDKNEENQ